MSIERTGIGFVELIEFSCSDLVNFTGRDLVCGIYYNMKAKIIFVL